MPGVKSVTAAAFQYFSRSNAGGIRRQPITERYAWIGSELTPDQFTLVLSTEQVAQIKAVVSKLIAGGKPLLELSADDFPLPLLEQVFRRVKHELRSGLGFILVRGLPVDVWSQAESECFFWGWGLHLGTCNAQDNNGELLGHVRDTGADPAIERQYKTRAAIDYHCDASDAVGLMCLGASKQGGESTLVSSAMAYNKLLASRPDLIDRLYDPVLLDVRGSGGIHVVPIEPVRHSSTGQLRTFWHHEYFSSGYGKPRAPPAMPTAIRELHEAYGKIIHDKDMEVRMMLQVGDIQMCSNHYILHARDAYEDRTGPGETQRHLLRLWITDNEPTSTVDWLSKTWHTVQVASRFVRAKFGI